LLIEGWGEIEVHAKGTSGKKQTFKLINVAFISSLQPSVASFSKMYDKGVKWDTERGVLTWKKQDLCSV
jgi:hypothetical protein